MKIFSNSYPDNGIIPVKYANKGVSKAENVSPHIKWTDFPKETKSFIVTIIDHHPIASKWVHWMIINIPKDISEIEENASNTNKLPKNCIELNNSFNFKGYGGPQPPVGSGKHNYVITVYALNTEKIDLPKFVSEKDLLSKINKFIIDKASLTGYFER